MSQLDAFVLDTPRPLPVILLLDRSGSMQGEKIAALNAAVRELYQDLASSKEPQGEVHLCTIEFATEVKVGSLSTASSARFEDLVADGRTSMGAALDALGVLLQDRAQLPARAYTPTVVLVSDGQPTDHYDLALERLLGIDRARRATRMALAIGEDADTDVLRRFVDDPETPVMKAREVAKIRDFFRWVSYSVQVRTKSRTPDSALVVSPSLADISDEDLVF